VRKYLTVLAILTSTALTWNAAAAEDLSLCRLGAEAMERGDFHAAVENMTLCLETGELSPATMAAAYNLRGGFSYILGEYDRAIEDYSRAIDLDPDLASAYSNRGVALVDFREFRRAIDDFDHAIEIDPDYAMAFNNRGNS